MPFRQAARFKEGFFEVFEPGAFTEEAAVMLVQGHHGTPIGAARVFPMPHGLYFEADVEQPTDVLRGGTGVSIEFFPQKTTVETLQGYQLQRVHEARLKAIALVKRPAYTATWCAPRSEWAWDKVYGPLRAELDRAVAEA